ncbi:MAG TPA: PAS domain S-box protein [Oligoflexus sp.]|uniref:PAS domain S-box protein n=1 Tax=Oligoflexus sp. TaxID=1971216 RepID=UPI002D7E638A|nr:PAS domain S-box protein [Oligoflexus sp.]HET9238671.1 PAS domain S-box protein [Oligoflexus sp.]
MQRFVRLFLPLLGLGFVIVGMSFLSPGTSGVLTTLLGLVTSAVIFLAYELRRERVRFAELEASEQLYKDSFERSNVGIAHATEDGHWIRVNSRFAQVLGCSREEVMGSTLRDFTHPDDRAMDDELTRKLWSGELASATLQKRFIRKDGSIVWVFLSATLSTARPGQPRYILRSIKDITAWKQAEAALTESSLQLRLATEAAQLGIWEQDLQTGRTRGNDLFWDMLGLANPGPTGTTELNRFIHDLDRAAVLEGFEESRRTGADYMCEYRFLKGEGTKIWLETTGSPIRNEKGEIIRFVGVTRDITDRKLAQLDFQRCVDVSPAILWITEEGGSCTYLSQQWFSFTGQTRSEALGFGWLDAVHDDDRETVRQGYLEATARRKPFYMEYRLRTASGAYRWVIDAGHRRFDADGVFLGYAGSIFDIHDRKEAQAKLEEAVLQFKALANSIPQLAWMADAQGYVFWYNDRWLQFTGSNLEAMKGNGWLDVHHPDHAQRVLKKYQDCLQSGQIWEDTFPLKSADGTWRWFLSRAIPICNEAHEIVQWFGTSTDITELREFQNALLESEARFRDLSNSMPQLVWTSNSAGQVDYYNERAFEYEGFQKDSEGLWNWQPGLHPDDLDATVRAWRAAVENKHLYTCEHRVRMKDGHYCWHLSRALPVFQENGEVKRWYGTATNIHEYKLALVELAKAKESAEEANKAKSRFLANMSHEIRSPMSSVLGYADLLLERGLPEADRTAYAASIKASGGHLLAIIDDILDLSAVESGEFKIDRHAFAMVDLVSETVKSMEVLAQRKGISLQVEFKNPVPGYIDSDPLRFRQILLNLLSNAIKFTEKGRIRISLSFQNEELMLEVEDSGVGIDASKAHKLFRAFSQVDSSISRRFGGTGLGLHLSRRLAEALGGDLVLSWSIPGVGSCFALTIKVGPASGPYIESLQDSQRIIAKASPQTMPAGGQYSVLLAEDSHDNQILIKIFLKKLGARVDVASNGEEAIRLARSADYDIILMDMMMPVMDGLEATRRLRSTGYRRPIVALTAHALKEEVEKSIAAGCDLHLTKPIQIDVLRRTIEVLLLKRRDHDHMLDAGLH